MASLWYGYEYAVEDAPTELISMRSELESPALIAEG